MNLRAWMKDIDDNRDIFSLNMVGTHDCVTQFVQLSYYARCQDRNIYEQLNIGVRCLDVRVRSSGERLGMVHGVCNAFTNPSHLSRKMDMADVLSHCYNFLDKNPSETIVFMFKNDSGKEMEKCFDIMYNAYIKPNSDRWFLENSVPKLNEARGKIVLLRRCKKYENKDYSLGTGIDFSCWIEQDSLTPNPLVLTTGENNNISFVIQDRFKYKPAEKWSLCVKPLLDKTIVNNDNYVINYLSTAAGRSPYKNARYINSQFMNYELKRGKYYGILFADFPTPELVKKVLETNI